jgi:hypothetical protein
VALLNRGKAETNISFAFENLPSSFFPSGDNLEDATLTATAQFDVLDLWADGASIGTHLGELSAAVEGTAAAFYKLIPTRPQVALG